MRVFMYSTQCVQFPVTLKIDASSIPYSKADFGDDDSNGDDDSDADDDNEDDGDEDSDDNDDDDSDDEDDEDDDSDGDGYHGYDDDYRDIQ